jgi:hypothetical protein
VTALKLCPACQKEKPLDPDFARNSAKKDGHRSRCKKCDLEHRPSANGGRHWHKPVDGRLRPWKCQELKSVELVYRKDPPSNIMPRGWYVRIDDEGYGVPIPARDTLVFLWKENQALKAKLAQLEGVQA